MPKRDGRDLARSLMHKAGGDSAILDRLLDDRGVPDDVLGFHAQQAVEKLLKAVLASSGVEFERTHNIGYLIALIEDAGITPPERAADLSALTPWATEFRYEDALGATIDREAVAALLAVVREWAETELAGEG